MLAEFIILFLLFYVWHGLGVTVGYHRLISHRSFACSKLVEYFWVLPGYLAFEGSPIWWATIHRAHHRHVDTPLDPHSPRHGLFRAHVGWLMEAGYPAHINPETQAKDLIKDPVYRFLEQGGRWQQAHRVAAILCIGFRLVLWAVWGPIPALASLAAGLAVQQIPFLLNVVCHLPKWGYRTFAVTDDSVNIWWVAILAMGEGWHNNHHASPGSAKTGLLPWEFDLSWITISLMKRLKLVTRVNVVSQEELTVKMLAKAAKQRAKKAPKLRTARIISGARHLADKRVAS